ncbi:MAG: isoleucine--tRNA ligase, partial [Beijerinckiaceae bacterium]
MNKPEKAAKTGAADYSATLYLPQTDFPMRAGLPQKEPEILMRWQRIGLYEKLREAAAGRARFVLHDGPPYANGNIHIGHALNKILKDLVTRSQQMLGKDSNYVPGWDCHGLPIEWKIEEEYRAKGKNKDEVPINEFRAQCRAFAAHWIDVQREEFKRLGVLGDWDHPYSTMDFAAEAQIVREIMKFAANGLLYRGSKPVMWSVVEKTALAEAEVEYEDYTSDTVWVGFPVRTIRNGARADARRAAEMSGENPQDVEATGEVFDELRAASVVIWTTTPWTLPGNRAIAFSSKVDYGLYRVTEAAHDNWAKPGALYILADRLASDVFKAARVQNFERVRSIDPHDIEACWHPLAERIPGYEFPVPLLEGEHVTDDAGTGFVHTAPGHGREDFDLWTGHARVLAARGVDTRIPYTVDADGFYTKEVPGFGGRRVIDDKGKKGDANDAVIAALIDASHLLARGRMKHSYPHSWRSKKPVIFRNTPQWFIAMDRGLGGASGGNAPTLRSIALDEIARTRWVPESGENRIRGMIENRPDWVVSRQRAWGVPIAVFVRKGTSDLLIDDAVNARIADAFEKEGADAWYKDDAAARFLAPEYSANDYEKIDDILDVWFDSGSTHAFTLDDPERFPGLAGLKRVRDGGRDEIMYLEGSDQHRGWFHSSLLESCGTRLRAPFDVVLTHGFTLDEQGRKMSKSLGNVTVPQKVISESGADILRLWVASVDYSDDQRIGPEILKSITDNYRKLRNTLRWMLGSLAHFKKNEYVPSRERPDLERYMLHRLAESAGSVTEAYAEFDYKKVVALITSFMVSDLSAFYFDVRKDTLYCDPPSSVARKSALATIDEIFERVTIWLAPILAFTCDEAWLARYPSEHGSVHMHLFPQTPRDWRNDALAAKWRVIRNVRRVVTGALEIERAAKRIGSSLEAAPVVYIEDAATRAALDGIDFAEICITSDIELRAGQGRADAFRLDDVSGVAVEPQRATGRKCARSWKISPLVGSDPEYPDIT